MLKKLSPQLTGSLRVQLFNQETLMRHLNLLNVNLSWNAFSSALIPKFFTCPQNSNFQHLQYLKHFFFFPEVQSKPTAFLKKKAFTLQASFILGALTSFATISYHEASFSITSDL